MNTWHLHIPSDPRQLAQLTDRQRTERAIWRASLRSGEASRFQRVATRLVDPFRSAVGRPARRPDLTTPAAASSC